MNDYRPADIPDADSFPATVHDALCAFADCVSLSSSSPWSSKHPYQSDPDRFSAGADILSHATGGGRVYQTQLCRCKPANLGNRGRGAGAGAAAGVYAALRKGEGCDAVCEFVERTASGEVQVDLSMRVVMPAYVFSELRTGFQIGAVLFLPFLAIDMAVASITTSVGMMQLPPVVISTPLKLLLFVMVDGWNLLVGSLMRSFL